MLAHFIAKRLRDEGFEILITSRKYDYLETLMETLGEKCIFVGEYGETIYEKLVADANRILELAPIIKKFSPEVLVSYPSPSAYRVAYGLKIRIIGLNDSPHSTIVNRLCLPLVDCLIAPACIAYDSFRRYLSPGAQYLTYDGVDEVLWMREAEGDPTILRNLGLSPQDKIVIFRPPEEKASYYHYDIPDYFKIMSTISGMGKVIFFPRYKYQELAVRRMFRGGNIIIPNRAIPLYKIYSLVSLVISGGASMAREAALAGTPSISMFPRRLEVNEFLVEKGFPLYHIVEVDDILNTVIAVLKNPNKYKIRVSEILKNLQTPLDPLLKALPKLLE